jgi:hypothetical protein
LEAHSLTSFAKDSKKQDLVEVEKKTTRTCGWTRTK